MDREQGTNLVFEAFAKERRKDAVSNLSSVNFGSPQTKTPAKIMMN